MSDGAPPPTPAPPPPGNRRFSDEEFALILKKASELQERTVEGGASGPGGRGLSLEEIRQIAAEAGIDPRYVDQAAAAVPTVWEGKGNALVGAPWSWEYRRTVPGRIPREEVARLLDALRSVMKQKGEVEDVYGTLEWHHDDELGPVLVRIVGRGDETHVEVSARRAGEVGLWYGLAVPLGGVLGGAALAGLLGVDGPEVLAPVLGMVGVSWIGTRALWRSLSANWERKLRTVTERVTEAARSVARIPPEGSAESGDPGSDYL